MKIVSASAPIRDQIRQAVKENLCNDVAYLELDFQPREPDHTKMDSSSDVGEQIELGDISK